MPPSPRHKAPTEPVSDDQGRAVGKTYLAVNRGFLALSLLLHSPPAWRRRARRKFGREQQDAIDRSLEQDPDYQAFIERYGDTAAKQAPWSPAG